MSVFWVQKLNESDSRLHKEDVLKQALEASVLGNLSATIFLCLLRVTYDTFITFGVKKVPTTTGITNAANPWHDFNDLLVRLSTRALTGNDALAAIDAMSKQFDSEQWNGFCALVIKRDLRAGISEKTINKICKGTQFEIPIFRAQLATNSENRPEMQGEKRLEPKLDGVRMLLICTYNDMTSHHSYTCTPYSRNGKVYENFKVIEDEILAHAHSMRQVLNRNSTEFQTGFVLDGEVTGQSFQELMKQSRRKKNTKADDSIFNVFDILPIRSFVRGWENAQLYKRIDWLNSLSPYFNVMQKVRLLPHIDVDLSTTIGKKDFNKYCHEMVNAGFEGIMIKNKGAPYECSRNLHWMKWKPTYDYDLEIVGIEEGSGKNKGRLGALVCEGWDDGRFIQVNVGSGFTDENRLEWWNDRNHKRYSVIGQMAVVTCDAVTMNQNGSYSLRFPRFKTFREDK